MTNEEFVEAVKYHAVNLILVHNHPSGDATPSQEDVTITTRMAQAGSILGIPLMDHIILGNQCYYSFCEHHAFTDEETPDGT